MGDNIETAAQTEKRIKNKYVKTVIGSWWKSFDANVSSFSLAESPPRDLQITAYKIMVMVV